MSCTVKPLRLKNFSVDRLHAIPATVRHTSPLPGAGEFCAARARKSYAIGAASRSGRRRQLREEGQDFVDRGQTARLAAVGQAFEVVAKLQAQ